MEADDANQWLLENHDYLSGLGIAIEQQEVGYVRLSLPHDDSIVNPESESGVIHGGVVATLIDHAGGAAIRTTLERPLETPHATSDLNVTYVRPATGDLTAEATVVRSGKTMGVITVEVFADTPQGEKTVAVGRLSIHIARDG